jgi:hypothetical protein
MKKLLNYIKSFWKYYILRKPKLVLTIILTAFVLLMIDNVIRDITLYALHGYNGKHEIWELFGVLCRSEIGIFVLFIKPIFIYIAGLIIINKI